MSIQFHVSVCDDKPSVQVAGRMLTAGFRGALPITHVIENDTLKIDLSACGHSPRVGDAKHIQAVSIRICSKSVTTIAIYDDPTMNLVGCCYCCDNGCCVYGSSGCGCT